MDKLDDIPYRTSVSSAKPCWMGQSTVLKVKSFLGLRVVFVIFAKVIL